MVVAGSSAAYVWSYTGELKHTLTGHLRQIYSVGIIDVRVITGSKDRTIKVWELNHGTCMKTIVEAKAIVNDLAISHQANSVISAHHDSFVRTFDLRTYHLVDETRVHNGQVTSVDLSQDEQYVVTCGKDSICRVWDRRVGFNKVLYSLSHDDFRVSADTNKAVFSPCASYVVSGTTSGQILVWHLVRGTPVVADIRAHNLDTMCVAWSPDGKTVASSGLDRKICTYYSG